MTRHLALIAFALFAVAAACGLVVLVTPVPGSTGGQRSWAATTWACTEMLWRKKADLHRDAASEPRTVDLEWQGGEAIRVDVPARVYYQPGPKAQASVSGEAELVSHVRMHDGKLTWDTVVNCLPADDLVVRITGPAVTAWTLSGSGELELSGIEQDELRITMRGSGTVNASGETHMASLDAAGSGRANLSRLDAQHAKARIRGSGRADLAAREDADIFISGSAVVTLHGAGARVQSQVSGSGQIRQVP